jgi:hypothetical protein
MLNDQDDCFLKNPIMPTGSGNQEIASNRVHSGAAVDLQHHVYRPCPREQGWITDEPNRYLD